MEQAFQQELCERRRKIREAIKERADGRGAALLLFSAPVHLRNGDVEHTYRPHSDFFYLSGFEEPEAALLILDGDPGFVLFVRERDPLKETWDGRRAGLLGAVSEYGADQAHAISELSAKLPEYLQNRRSVHYLIGETPEWDRQVISALGSVRSKRIKRVDAPEELVDARLLLHEARLFKSDFEIEGMAKVGQLAAEGHREAMRKCAPGMTEWQLQDVVESTFRAGGARKLAYDSIVGSGENATILHYRENKRQMQEGELVLIDAGAELDCLAADITRTFPVAGKFSPLQRKIYEIVLGAQSAAIEACVPGRTLEDVHDAALKVTAQGLKDLGLMREEDLASEEATKKRTVHFFLHRTSHYLGMDVHDVGRYHQGGKLRTLEPRMVITVEPGLYFAPDDESVPAEFRGIGVRIEDDILITSDAPRNLTSYAPKTVAEVEAACATI